MADDIPGPDASFQASASRTQPVAVQLRWLAFHASRPRADASLGANANLAALGVVAADNAPITAARTRWQTAFPAYVAAAEAAKRTD